MFTLPANSQLFKGKLVSVKPAVELNTVPAAELELSCVQVEPEISHRFRRTLAKVPETSPATKVKAEEYV